MIVALALAGSTTGLLSAQQIEARIVGKLVDSSGAALPGVTVTVTSAQTGATRVDVSDGTGDFAITNLGPGAYYGADRVRWFRVGERARSSSASRRWRH